jgi:transcriptional regulator with XRE-family HTH domain
MSEPVYGRAVRIRAPRLRVKELREARGLTVTQLAERAGCATSTIIRLERGNGRPNRTDLERFAAALGVMVEELIDPAQGRR